MSTNLDILNMTDEEFSRLSEPSETSAEEPEEEEETEEEVTEEETPDHGQENSQDDEDPESSTETEEEEIVEDAPGSENAEGDEPKAAEEPKTGPGAEEKPSEPKGEKAASAEGEAPDYKAFFERVMAPFKANGKMIQLDSPEDVIQLMQMGANYTRKMQEMAKYRKHLLMLENNQLLDEGKLSFLIDLEKKNPEAIRKLLKEANIDPIDIDTSSALNYKEGQHVVSDREANLVTHIEDLQSLPGGNETLQSIRETWDQASKELLSDHPQVLHDIHAQRTNGVYARIAAEVDRQRALGRISVSTPFLLAYEQIGNVMKAQGAFNDILQPAHQAPAPGSGRTPLATRAQKTSKNLADNQKVKAAAPPRNATKQAKQVINPLALSDEEFLKLEPNF